MTSQVIYPVKLMGCDCCGKTMWRFSPNWIQCPDYGAKSTNYRGCFPYIHLNKVKFTVSQEMLNLMKNEIQIH